jgi:B12-binding domain/radical SAM domain protein
MPSIDIIFLHAPSVYDFREKAILYGPISDLVPSKPVFEMYPIGFATLTDYLERHGFRARIVNLAVRMLYEKDFDAEKLIASLDPRAFGIDLHWLPHAHGSLEVARLVKKYHPDTPVIFGGFSATYFHRELIARAGVDFVVRGDSTEEPVRMLMAYLRGDRGAVKSLAEIPNLTFRDPRSGAPRANPLTYSPGTLDHLALDYRRIVRSVMRDRDLSDYLPFASWLDYPIMAGLTCRGCQYRCATCGGSADAFRNVMGRARPAFRSPEKLAGDVHAIQRFSRGPVFVLGDIRQNGIDYARRFLRAMAGTPDQVILELFAPASREFLRWVADALPNFVIEVSLESHDPRVRRAFKSYSNAEMEQTIQHALAVGCRRLDVYFMTGLPAQTPDSVMQTIDYAHRLLKRYDGGGRVLPFISPLAPFVDPGSRVFENPEPYGYHLFARTLEEHRRRLVAPSWKYVLNYETDWMSRDQIVAATYEAGRRLNALKAEYGLVSADLAARTEARIRRAVELIGVVDALVARGPEIVERELIALKPEIDQVNESTVCEKKELDLPVGVTRFNALTIARAWVEGTAESVVRALTPPAPRQPRWVREQVWVRRDR